MRDRVPAAAGVHRRVVPAGEAGELVAAQAQGCKDGAEPGPVHRKIRKASTALAGLHRLGAAMGGVPTASKDSGPDHLKSVIDPETGIRFDPDTRSGGIRIRTTRGFGAASTWRDRP